MTYKKIEITIDTTKYEQLKILSVIDGVSVEELILELVADVIHERYDEIGEFYSDLDDEDENFNKFAFNQFTEDI